MTGGCRLFDRRSWTIPFDKGLQGALRFRSPSLDCLARLVFIGVTGGDQGVTGGYRGLQGVTGGDKRLHGGYKG